MLDGGMWHLRNYREIERRLLTSLLYLTGYDTNKL
jgi:hypothetical protein